MPPPPPALLWAPASHMYCWEMAATQHHSQAGQQKLRQCKATAMLEASAQPAPVAVRQGLLQCCLSRPCQSNKRAAKGHPRSLKLSTTQGVLWQRTQCCTPSAGPETGPCCPVGVAGPTGNCTQLQSLIRRTHIPVHTS
jgi:hypothetical protein